MPAAHLIKLAMYEGTARLRNISVEVKIQHAALA